MTFYYNKQIRIFLVSNMYPSKKHPDYGVFVKNFKENLDNKGAKFPHISVIKGRSKGFDKLILYALHYAKILSIYRKNNFNLIYIHFISHNAPIFFLALLLFKKRKSIVVNLHGSDVIKYNYGIYKYFNKRLLKKIDLVVVPSAYFSREVSKRFPFVKKDKLFINPSGGIDLTKFYPLNKPKTKEEIILGFVSRIDPKKGWNDFVSLILKLKNSQIKIKGLIAGTGSQVEMMLAQIEENGLSNCIKYIGVVKQSKLVAIYNQMDLFVFSTKEPESLGLVGLEAMACGVPIVAANEAGVTTYTRHGYNGFLFEPNKKDEMADAVIRFINLSESEKLKMKKNAQSTAYNYSKERTTEAMFKKLKTII